MKRWLHKWFPYVGIYETWQGYGGPEEGGWWYDCGRPVEGRRVSRWFIKIYQWWLERKITQEDPRYHFVVGGDTPTYYGSKYEVQVHASGPTSYPEVRPHYC